MKRCAKQKKSQGASMSDEKHFCPLMTGAAMIIGDLTTAMINPAQAKAFQGRQVMIVSEIKDHRVPCMQSQCELWVKRQDPKTKMVYEGCTFKAHIPFDQLYHD